MRVKYLSLLLPPPTLPSSPAAMGCIKPPPTHPHVAVDLLCCSPCRYHAPLSAAAARSRQSPALSVPLSRHVICHPITLRCVLRPPPLVVSSPAQLPYVFPFSVTGLSRVVHPFLLATMLAAPSRCIEHHPPTLPFDCCVLALMLSPASHHRPLPQQNCHCNR
jgi:hypothetical protein